MESNFVPLFSPLIIVNSHLQGLRYLPGLKENLPLTLNQSINRQKRLFFFKSFNFFSKNILKVFPHFETTVLHILEITSKLFSASSECFSLP